MIGAGPGLSCGEPGSRMAAALMRFLLIHASSFDRTQQVTFDMNGCCNLIVPTCCCFQREEGSCQFAAPCCCSFRGARNSEAMPGGPAARQLGDGYSISCGSSTYRKENCTLAKSKRNLSKVGNCDERSQINQLCKRQQERGLHAVTIAQIRLSAPKNAAQKQTREKHHMANIIYSAFVL